MEKKRLVLSGLRLVLIIFVSLSLIPFINSQNEKFDKEQVLVISGDDGTDKNDDSCTEKPAVFNPGSKINYSNGINFKYQKNAQTNQWGYTTLKWKDNPIYSVLEVTDDYQGYENADIRKLDACVWSKEEITKGLKNLKGCPVLVEEWDGESNYPNDCGGWLIPPGEKSIINMHSKYGAEKDPSLLNMQEYLDNSFFKLGILKKVVLNGQTDFDEGDTSNLACQMKQNYFSTIGEAYICLDNGESAYNWYKCDKESVGQFMNYTPSTGEAWFCMGDTTSTIGGYNWVKQQIKCDTQGVDCDTDKTACINTLGDPLGDEANPAWSEEIKQCCGDDGEADWGKISEDKTKICFNDLITSEDAAYDKDTNMLFYNYINIKNNYNSGWKWIPASEGFIIKTKTIQSFLSNGAYWYVCNDSNSGPLKKDGIGSAGDIGKAGRFFCLGNGKYGSWKECITADEQKQFNDYSHHILLGESLFTLYPHTPDSTTISAEGQILSSGVPLQYERKGVPESPPMLKIIFSFTEDPYLKLAIENLEPKVTFSGLSPENTLIEDNLFNDYLSVPYLEKDVPLTADVYYPVKEPTISSVIPAQIKKVYITTDDSFFCSGKEEFEEGKSSWIADLDDSPKLPGDKTACESNGYTWTGTRCCGDDISSGLDDFYANDGFVTGLDDEGYQILDLEKPRGCWAGIPLKDGEAVGQIRFTISAGNKILDELYPCKKETGKECRYFIKGIINNNKIIENVKLSNSYPEKYDLTARLYNKAAHQNLPFEIKITAEGVEIDRNKYYLEAKNVPVVAIVGKDENGNGKFFTCGADLIGIGAGIESKIKEMPLCAISGDNYCSAQGWTNKAPAKFNFNPETKEYEPTEEAYEPAVFNHSGSVVFGRNLIPNANFVLNSPGNLDKWQKVGKGGLYVKEEKLLVQGEFISPPIYLEKDSYIISFTSDCDSNDEFDIYLSDNPATDSVKGPKLNSLPKEYTTHGDWRYNREYSVESGKYWLKLRSKEKECSIGEFTLYRNQGTLTPFNYDALHQPMAAQQCCPENTCWNGFTCAEDMSLQTEREETVADGVSYRCLKGNWVAQEKKWDWAHKVKGYCEKESQCFVAPITPANAEQQGAEAGLAAGEFYKGKTPSCINDSEFIFDHYCHEGEWTTRTKFLIESLQSLAKKNDYPKYTIYCSPYTETLNEYGSSVYDMEQFIGGGQDYTKTSTDKGCQFTKDDPACQTTGKLCFSGANSNLVPNEENTCVNNFCLLTREEDKQQKTIFAVSLNQPIDDTSYSFLFSLGIENSEEIKSYCPKEGDDWVDCQNKVGFLKYHPKLNMVAYSSEEFEFEPGTLAKLWTGVKDAVGGAIDFIGGLLGFEADKVAPGQLPEPLKDKLTTTAFTTCPSIDTSRYFSFFGEGKSAVACVWNNTLSASYYNFVTPLCDFASHTPKEKQFWLTEEPHEGKILPVQGEDSIICDDKSNNLIVSDPNDIAFWWPQLTGRLRIN